MLQMSWEYLAGFFDGEGTIRQDSASHWSLAQTRERGLELLREIQEFLSEQGIPSSLHVRRKPDKAHTLYVSNRKDVACLIQHLYPYLRIKRVECQDAVRFMKLFPPRSQGSALGMQISEARQRNHGNAGERHGKAKLTAAQVNQIREELRNGVPRVELAERFGIHYNTVSSIKYGTSWSHNARV